MPSDRYIHGCHLTRGLAGIGQQAAAKFGIRIRSGNDIAFDLLCCTHKAPPSGHGKFEIFYTDIAHFSRISKNIFGTDFFR